MWEVLRQFLDSGLFQKVPQEKREGEEIQEEGQGSFSAGDILCDYFFRVPLICV